MKNQNRKIAVVGFGYWGQKLAAASTKAGLQVVVVDAAQQTAAPYPLLSWEEVLVDAAVLGVIIATPEKTHAELVIAALENNKAVLVEKPATTDAESWAACVELATQNNLPLLVDYTFLHSQALAQWKTLTQIYSAQLGKLQQLTTVRKTQMSQERIAGKALPIWWDVVIHDLYLARAVFQETPQHWKILTAQLPSQIKAAAELGEALFIADYSWVSPEIERSWLTEYEHGSVLWQRVKTGEAFEVRVKGKKVFETIIADQNPSPLDTLIHSWLQLWQQKNLAKLQKKHWAEVASDIATLMQLSNSLTAQVATR